MKSRSHRPSAKDDWVEEESWTVDCICGVNFDDGEEMVDCDECGVWVHTRCSRYVKGEKVFSCDKCKAKNIRNDSEETEVAQLLVELPTKTLRMDKPPASSYNPPRRPFRLWSDIPIEERVHVQGVPGGDPSLFSDLSIFGPQLWKSTGYVPKKFNSRYKEFPSWDGEGELPKEILENATSRDTYSTADNGAGVLLSMSKEDLSPVPVLETVGVKSQAEDVKIDRLVKSQAEDVKIDRLKSSEPMTNVEDENLKVSILQDGMKDQSLLQSSAVQSGKCKKEDLGMLKDKNVKKKARSMERDGDFKKKPLHTTGTDRGLKAVNIDPQSSKNANMNNLPAGQLSQKVPAVVDHVVDDHKCHLASIKTSLQKPNFDASRVYSNGASMSKEDHGGHGVPARSKDSPKTTNGMASPLACSDSVSFPLRGEVVSDTIDGSNAPGGGLSTIMADLSPPFVENVKASLGNHSTADSTINLEINVKAKAEFGNNHEALGVEPSPPCDSKLDTAGTLAQYQENSADCLSEIEKSNVAADTNSEASNTAEDAGRSFGLVNVRKDRTGDESADNHHEYMQDSGISEDSLGSKKCPTGFVSKSVDEQSNCTGTIPMHSAAMGVCKFVTSVGSPSLTSSIDVSVTKSPPANHIDVSVQSQDMDTRQKGTSESNFSSNKDNSDTFSEAIKDEENHEKQKQLVKEPGKSSLNSVSKLSSKKVLHASVSKRTLSESKESILHSTPKSPPPLPNVSATSHSEASAMMHIEGATNLQKKGGTFQAEIAPNVQKKVGALPQKGEKINQSVSQSSSKASTSLPHAAASSSSPATLSDEELALLLHQELNSSPRVPRVPRMRHAGSLPQLTSPTATSMLMKRSSSTGGKEHILTFRRKAKDSTKDGLHGVREVEDENTKKMERVPSSSDHGRQDSASSSDLVSKREVDGTPTKVIQSIKKGNASVSGSSGLSSPTEANERNLLSAHQSPRNPPDDGKGVVSRSTHRTLPGLIAEIMSKGERMTYEELCNAVLPHWPNLRKHNGERYAYSSHSQAVLDCLRNRSEWARLVDRGPKTSGGRKRRKLDVDPTGIDSEDNDDNRERTAHDVRRESIESHHEEFPKGKRKARRRRLALQGRGIKDVRRRRRIEEFSDDEVASFSNSSEETILSEEETQGVGISRARNEISTASDGI